nr:probable receptor-like protein kinase At1g80640 [Quercus suber]
MVASWILNSVSQEIATSIVHKDTALEIWNDLRERLSQANGPRVFQLQKDIAFTNNETHMTNNVIQLAVQSTSMAEFVANNLELGSPTISEERIPSLVEYSFTPSAKLESVSSVLNGTNPIPANNSYTDANGARNLSISLLFPPAMSEIETDDSCSESNETPRAAAQFSYSISSCFPPGRSETDSNSEIYEIIPTDPSNTASPTATFKEILKPKVMSLKDRSKRPRHTVLTTRFKDLEIIDREKFPLKMLLEATNNFSEDRKIETDYIGPMYHAILDDGRELAIYRAKNSMSKQFLRKLEALSQLDHKNVVRLLGFCEDSKDGLLVYEYMGYGTLHHHLHNPDSTSLMSWDARIKVALDIARGIEYLHAYTVPPIIHRDIKPFNIFLDATLTAKLSNFGLSVVAPGDGWYMEPEYAINGSLTTKVDVYSFGVVLLEMLFGCKIYHGNNNYEEGLIVDFVPPYTAKKEIHRFLDPKVPPPTPLEMEALANFASLALDCVSKERELRPSMTKVANTIQSTLKGILEGQVIAYNFESISDAESESIIDVECESITDSEIEPRETGRIY